MEHGSSLRRLGGVLAAASVAAIAAAGFHAPPAHADPVPGADQIAIENAQPGTTSWFVPSPKQAQISAYMGDVSYAPGDSAALYVDSDADPFTYTVFRMGWYGGAGGRQMLSQSVASNASQPKPEVADDRNLGEKLLTTGWHQSASFQIPSDWISGYYLVKVTDSLTGASSYANFVLRAASPAAVVVVYPSNTWQAYNAWGGLSLYRDLRMATLHDRQNPAYVAHVVSFLRPYDEDAGAAQWFRIDRPLTQYLEQNGMPVSYATDEDVRLGRVVGPDTKLVIMDGHAEYQDMSERNQLFAWRRSGIDIALTGGNDFVTQSRFDDTIHQMTVWREKRLDPVKDSTAAVIWEQVNWSQNQLTGVMQAWGSAAHPEQAYATSSWPWAGASVSPGTSLGTLQGAEFEGSVVNASSTPHELVLARSVLGAGGVGGPKQAYAAPAAQEMTLMQLPGQGWVFAGGQNCFDWYLAYPDQTPPQWIAWAAGRYPASSQVSRAVQRLVGNLIQNATGFPNPIPAASQPPKRVTPALRILSPIAGQPVIGTPGRSGVTWSDAPAGTVSVVIYANNKKVGAVAPPADSWIGYMHARGMTTIKLVAVGNGAKTLASAQVRVDMLAPTAPVFVHNQRVRDWNDHEAPGGGNDDAPTVSRYPGQWADSDGTGGNSAAVLVGFILGIGAAGVAVPLILHVRRGPSHL